MECAPHDSCMLIKKSDDGSSCNGVILLQVDDSTAFGTSKFQEEQEKASSRFENHGTVEVGPTPIVHNGAEVSLKGNSYVLYQGKHLEKVKEIPLDLDEEEAFSKFRSMNAMAAYPASLTRPDLLCYTSRYSQITRDKFTVRSRKAFNKFVKVIKESISTPMTFTPLDEKSVHVVVYTDASFSSVDEEKS